MRCGFSIGCGSLWSLVLAISSAVTTAAADWPQLLGDSLRSGNAADDHCAAGHAHVDRRDSAY